jgi:hypothetical protein
MFNTTDIPSKVRLTKNLITDQSYDGVLTKLNAADTVFSVTEGLGSDNGSSTIFLVNVGGFDDQQITAVLKFVAPTTAGSEEIGVMLRVIALDSTDDSYYYARVDGGLAKLTKVVNEIFTTLSQNSFALAQDQLVTITFSVVGSRLSATFDAGGSPATVTLSATDTDIPSGGLIGIRSLSSTVYCRSFTAEQL